MEKFWTLLFLIEILMFLICTVYSCFYECLNSFFELEKFHIRMSFLIFEPKFKRKKVLSWFTIVFTNSFDYFITLGLNHNNWKWRKHNLWHQFWIWYWYFRLYWDYSKIFQDFQMQQKWRFSQSQRSTDSHWYRFMIS